MACDIINVATVKWCEQLLLN